MVDQSFTAAGLCGAIPIQIVVAGDSEQDRRLVLAGRDVGLQALQQVVDGVVLLPLAGEREIAGEQDQVPGAALGMQLGKLVEEDLLRLGPEPFLSALTGMEIGNVQPI